MFQQLPRDRYAIVEGLFSELSFNIQIPSILEGNSRGQVFVDEATNPQIAIIWDQLASVYIAGKHTNQGAIQRLHEWIAGVAHPRIEEIGFPSLTIQTLPGDWNWRLMDLSPGYNVHHKKRRYYTHPLQKIPNSEQPPGYLQQAIDDELLQQGELGGLNWLRGWINSFWPSLEVYKRLGFGYCLISQERAIASFCFSVFVSRPQYELATATAEEHLRRGLSSAATVACLERCYEQGYKPVWHCWDDNLASTRVAQKVGFELQKTYNVLNLECARAEGT